jgi:hypothetical protein
MAPLKLVNRKIDVVQEENFQGTFDPLFPHKLLHITILATHSPK